MNPRLEFITVPSTRPAMQFCAAVAEGLTAARKHLPSRFFYDEAGSQLFERICDLPEYYLTRTERGILQQHAGDIIGAARTNSAGEPLALVEFGSGSSDKTRLLLQAALACQDGLRYIPIDISGDFLRQSCLRLLDEYPRLAVTALAAEYNDALFTLPSHNGPRLLVFLGSNIGNFTHEEAMEFLARMRVGMRPQDRLLLGVDLVKDCHILEAAYNDAAGITARFNQNILHRVNRELNGNFDLAGFRHHAPFIENEARIEMRLVSERDQSVRIGELDMDFDFAAGEILRTEYSHKYTLDSMEQLCRPVGLEVQDCWQDARKWFALLLLRPSAAEGIGTP